MGNAWTCRYVDSQTEYSRWQGYALHLVGPARCGVLWAFETEWNHHRGSVSNAIDAFEPRIEGQTAIVPRETRQNHPPVRQCLATRRKTAQDILGNTEMGGLNPPAVLYRSCSFRLPFVSIDGTRPGSSAFPLLRRNKKIERFVDYLKRRIVFSRSYPTIAREMEKSSGQRRTVFWIINRCRKNMLPIGSSSFYDKNMVVVLIKKHSKQIFWQLKFFFSTSDYVRNFCGFVFWDCSN